MQIVFFNWKIVLLSLAKDEMSKIELVQHGRSFSLMHFCCHCYADRYMHKLLLFPDLEAYTMPGKINQFWSAPNEKIENPQIDISHNKNIVTVPFVYLKDTEHKTEVQNCIVTLDMVTGEIIDVKNLSLEEAYAYRFQIREKFFFKLHAKICFRIPFYFYFQEKNGIFSIFIVLGISIGHFPQNITFENKSAAYPILKFRDALYFPLTWQYAHEVFGWDYQWAQIFRIFSNGNIDNVVIL